MYLEINNELSLIENLSKIDLNWIAIDNKNKKLYFKKNNKKINCKEFEYGDKNEEEILSEMEIVNYNIIEQKVMNHKEFMNYYSDLVKTSDIWFIDFIKRKKFPVFILEDIETKEYLGCFINNCNKKWENNYSLWYKICSSNISRLPFYLKENNIILYTSENNKTNIDNFPQIYDYQIDRVNLGYLNFWILYTLNWFFYIKIIEKSSKSKTYNITDFLLHKKDDIIQLWEFNYINNYIPYFIISLEQEGENIEINWLHNNNFFWYIQNEELKILENVIDYKMFNNDIYTISLIQDHYYLYKNWTFLKNFKFYYGLEKKWNEILLYSKEYDSISWNVSVSKIWKFGQMEFVRDEKKQFNLLDMIKNI